ncbi:MAG: phytase [Bacteroidetes bacterium]|nr:phytase [Bacteroidota bacterium]
MKHPCFVEHKHYNNKIKNLGVPCPNIFVQAGIIPLKNNFTMMKNEIKFKAVIILIGTLILFIACQNQIGNNNEVVDKKNTEAREDSIKMAEAIAIQTQIGNPVQAIMETDAVYSAVGEDAADDPAIWVNQINPEKSLIIGTDKKAGLYVFNLEGKVTQFLRAGELNNVDLRDGFVHMGKTQVLISASNRSINSISIFLLNPETGLISNSFLDIKSKVDEVYGLCMYKDPTNRFYVFVNGKNGIIEQYEIISENNSIISEYCRGLKVNSQPEGMVANDLTADLYIGVEQEGIFRAGANRDANDQLELLPLSSGNNNQNITYDIEGLAIYQTSDESYLIASIQGNFSYAIYDIKNTDSIKYLTSFTIKEGLFDGVEETDGIEVTSFPINSDYPKGMLVVQDGFNFDGKTAVSQNFKYISWADIEKYLK